MNKDFLYNIKDIYNRPGQMRELSREIIMPENWGEGLALVPAGEILKLDARVESVHEGILVTANAQTNMRSQCGRCLKDFSDELKIDFTELFAYNPTEADEYGVHGDHVNLEPPLRDELVLALPFQPVCRADCAGLDPDTGEARTEAAASADTAIDPRWAALAGFSVTETDKNA